MARPHRRSFADGNRSPTWGSTDFADLAEAALAPSPAQLVRDVDPELRPFFEELYARPEMTDLVWLNMFRIVSSAHGPREARAGHDHLPADRQRA